jgi:hypothetical protein
MRTTGCAAAPPDHKANKRQIGPKRRMATPVGVLESA